ncbi:MAG: MarR family winged helix-turn-helix transcriptional regulator [Anaerofustis sp.]
MQMSLHYLLMLTQNNFYRKILSDSAQFGLSPGQPKILEYLSSHDGCKQSSIAKGCSLQPPTVTGLLRRMKENGLIECVQNPSDKKSQNVSLSPKGRDALRIVEKIFSDAENVALKGLSKQEYQTFMHILMKLYFNTRSWQNE